MKQDSTFFIKLVIVLLGIGTLAVMLGLPPLEGRNANADLASIYLRDPLLAYAYLASIPYFVALFQAARLLGYIEQDRAFSSGSVRALWIIKLCAITLIGLIVAGEAFILWGGDGDRAGIVASGIYAVFAAVVIATATAILEKLCQNAVDLKTE